MKKRPILINTSRGEIHNEEDILWALENQVLGGAGLDVTNPEPTSAQNPLLAHPRCLITPHIGSATHEAREKMSEISCLNILNAFQGNPLPGPVSD
jgi:glyoxylate reductase